MKTDFLFIFWTHSVFFLHKKAISAVHSLLCSHDADSRYKDPQVRAHVAKLYLPLVAIVMETLNQLYDFSGQHAPLTSFITLHFHLLQNISFHCNYTWECFYCVFVDSSPARVRHASAHDDADPDSGNTISQSVAMAIAGSPLPHAKANSFALPTVVSDNGRGQAVPLGTRDWWVRPDTVWTRICCLSLTEHHTGLSVTPPKKNTKMCILSTLLIFPQGSVLVFADRGLSAPSLDCYFMFDIKVTAWFVCFSLPACPSVQLSVGGV